MTYQLISAWPEPPDEVRDEVIRFWLATGALPDLATAQERSRQLLVVARDTRGQVVGVSTAVRVLVHQLGCECFYYRTFVAPAARNRGLRSTQLVWQILHESYRLLNERFLHGFDRDVPGLYAEMENPSVMRRRNEAVWEDNGMNFVFIGRTEGGYHMRVWYFSEARIP